MNRFQAFRKEQEERFEELLNQMKEREKQFEELAEKNDVLTREKEDRAGTLENHIGDSEGISEARASEIGVLKEKIMELEAQLWNKSALLRLNDDRMNHTNYMLQIKEDWLKDKDDYLKDRGEYLEWYRSQLTQSQKRSSKLRAMVVQMTQLNRMCNPKWGAFHSLLDYVRLTLSFRKCYSVPVLG
jgi:hypothetical protein